MVEHPCFKRLTPGGHFYVFFFFYWIIKNAYEYHVLYGNTLSLYLIGEILVISFIRCLVLNNKRIQIEYFLMCSDTCCLLVHWMSLYSGIFKIAQNLKKLHMMTKQAAGAHNVPKSIRTLIVVDLLLPSIKLEWELSPVYAIEQE